MAVRSKIIAGAIIALATLGVSSVQANTPQITGNRASLSAHLSGPYIDLWRAAPLGEATNIDTKSARLVFDLGFELWGPLVRTAPRFDVNPVPTPHTASIFLRAKGKAAIATTKAAAAPIGFQLFCLRNAKECSPDNSGVAQLTPELIKQISTINTKVNKAMVARQDAKADQWAMNAAEGDCEDYALTKRYQLAAAGIPRSALRIATARTSWGEGHAVLIIRTDKGDLVLDNLNNEIKPWTAIDISLIAISGENPTQWFAVS